MAAAQLLQRVFKGSADRRQLLMQLMGLQTQRRFYFPARCRFEALALINRARRICHMPTLSARHRFEASDFIGIRLPDPDETPVRESAFANLLTYRSHCLVRPRLAGRFPDRRWDGPIHQIADRWASEDDLYSHGVLRRRGAAVNSRDVRAFLESCAPGPGHPVDIAAANCQPCEPEAPGGSVPSRCPGIQKLLERSDADSTLYSKCPRACITGFVSPVKCFLDEARELGGKPLTLGGGRVTWDHGAVMEDGGCKTYRDTLWLNQPLVCYEAESERMGLTLVHLLLDFNKEVSNVPLLKPLPFLLERSVKLVAAATIIQATWRAHRTRRTLGSGLLAAVVRRRAVMCLQRFWRWGILKRRFELLIGAANYLRGIQTSHLYIEERLFQSLNLISTVDRYAPRLRERSLGFGFAQDSERVVLVCPEGPQARVPTGLPMVTGGGGPRSLQALGRATITLGRFSTSKGSVQPKRIGLPNWFMERVEDLHTTWPNDNCLKAVDGLQGMLTEGLDVQTALDYTITVNMPSIANDHAHMVALLGEDDVSAAHSACAGQLRYVSLAFPSVAAARTRALAVYLCTFNASPRTLR